MRANLLSFQLIKSKLKPTWFSFRKLSRAFCRWHVFTLAIGCMVFCACYWLHFSRAYHQFHVFPHLPSVAWFPVLAIGCMFSRACHRLHVFPRLPLVADFPTFFIGYMFPALVIGCHWFPVSLSFSPVLPALATDGTKLPQVLFGLTSFLPQ